MRYLIIALLWFSYIFSYFYSIPVFAFDYFENDIDYWNENKKEKPVKVNAPIKVPKPIMAVQDSKEVEKDFNWKNALNPKKQEFWKEGNHIPPAAFIEVANDPSDKNLKNWFKLIEKKNKLSKRLTEKIAAYVSKNGATLKPPEAAALQQVAQPMPTTLPDFKRYKIRMYFESSCPHCHRMMGTMKELQQNGYFVELKQVDKDTRLTKGLPFPVIPVGPGELKKMKVTGWPVLFIADLKKKVLLRLDGYKSFQEVITHINSQKK